MISPQDKIQEIEIQDLKQRLQEKERLLDKEIEEIKEMMKPLLETYQVAVVLGKWIFGALVFLSVLLGIILSVRQFLNETTKSNYRKRIKKWPAGNIYQGFAENFRLYNQRYGILGHGGIDISGVNYWGKPVVASRRHNFKYLLQFANRWANSINRQRQKRKRRLSSYCLWAFN